MVAAVVFSSFSTLFTVVMVAAVVFSAFFAVVMVAGRSGHLDSAALEKENDHFFGRHILSVAGIECLIRAIFLIYCDK